MTDPHDPFNTTPAHDFPPFVPVLKQYKVVMTYKGKTMLFLVEADCVDNAERAACKSTQAKEAGFPSHPWGTGITKEVQRVS
jgi:hypothetical protein